MTAKTLEEEAREAAEAMIDRMFPGDYRWQGTSPEYHRKGYIKGFIAAATARDAEIASLRARLEAVPVEEIRTSRQTIANERELDTIDRWLATVTKG